MYLLFMKLQHFCLDLPPGLEITLGGYVLLDWLLADGGFRGRVGSFPRLYQSSSPTRVEPRGTEVPHTIILHPPTYPPL